MTMTWRKTQVILSTTLVVLQVFFLPVSMIYAEIVEESDSFLSETLLEESELDQKNTMLDKENNFSTSNLDEDASSKEQANSEQSDEIRFALNVGEYVQVTAQDSQNINIQANQPIDKFRVVIPKKATFSVKNEKDRKMVESYEDGSSAWLISLNEKQTSIPMELTVIESGQMSVEDSAGQVHAAFLYLETQEMTRADSVSRSTVRVSTWAAFRTAWNNQARTVITLVSNITRTASTTLNRRTTNVIISSSSAGSYMLLSNENYQSELTIPFSSNITLSNVQLEWVILDGGNLVIDKAVISGDNKPGTKLDNLTLSQARAIFPFGITVRESLSMTGQFHLANPTANYSSPVLSNNVPLIEINTTSGLALFLSSTVKPIVSWPVDLFTATIRNGIVTASNQSTLTNETAKIIFSSALIRNMSTSDEVVPPIIETSVTVNYIDSSGNELAPTEIIKGNVGDNYETSPKDISGWNLIEEPRNSRGTFTVEPIIVNYVYEKKTTHKLALEANPTVGGNPESDLTDLTEEETTIITANPSNGYRFVQWEIISGNGSTLEDENSQETTFTMGSDNAVVQAIYEEDPKDLDPVSPVDPLDPEMEVDPENKPDLPEDQGPLSIDFVSSFNFGSQAISVHDQTYYAQPQRLLNEDGALNENEVRPTYVQISDRRSENERSGWELAVTQQEQFKGKENQVLNGASLSLKNQQVITAQGGTVPGLQSVPCTLVPGNRRTLLKAQGSEGAGTWIYRFGDGETAGKSVILDVPRGANPEATSYSTTLTWELSTVPDN